MEAHLKLISRNAENILSLEDAKKHLRVTDNDEDALILSYISAAIATAEDETERKIFDSVYDLRLEAKDMEFQLPYPGFKALEKIILVSDAGVSQVLWEEGLNLYAEVDDWVDPAIITLKNIPSGKYLILRIRFGWDLMPDSLLNAIKMVLYHYYDNRSEVEVGRTANQVPMGAKRIFHMHRYQRFA